MDNPLCNIFLSKSIVSVAEGACYFLKKNSYEYKKYPLSFKKIFVFTAIEVGLIATLLISAVECIVRIALLLFSYPFITLFPKIFSNDKIKLITQTGTALSFYYIIAIPIMCITHLGKEIKTFVFLAHLYEYICADSYTTYKNNQRTINLNKHAWWNLC